MVHIPPLAKRVGIVVPPPNPAVEPEMRALLPQDIAIYTAGLPFQPGADLAARNRSMPDHFVESIRSFGSLPLDAALIAAITACAGGPRVGAPQWPFTCTTVDATFVNLMSALGRGC